MYVTITHMNDENRKLQHIQFILLNMILSIFARPMGLAYH